MKYFITCLAFFMTATCLRAQESIILYKGEIPGSKSAPAQYKEAAPTDDKGVTRISKVSVPTLTVFLPAKEKSNGTAVIICPGGGYDHLAIDHEGYDVARRFNEIGVTAFVLKYRLPSNATMIDKSFGPLTDAQQAIYLVRRDASKWNIKPDKIGIMGFSAGGHLASTLSVHYDDVKIENKEKLSLRPDFSILIYPVISFIESVNQGSVNNLIGTDGSQAQREYFSSEKHVKMETPPTFLVQANDDPGVPVQNSILFNQALVKAHVKVEMHLYQSGGHGFGLKNKTTSDDWFERLMNWMKANKLI